MVRKRVKRLKLSVNSVITECNKFLGPNVYVLIFSMSAFPHLRESDKNRNRSSLKNLSKCIIA